MSDGHTSGFGPFLRNVGRRDYTSLLDGRREQEADLREVEHLRPEGLKVAVVRNIGGDGTQYRVGVNGRHTFYPGDRVLAASNTGHPGERILSDAPPSSGGASSYTASVSQVDTASETPPEPVITPTDLVSVYAYYYYHHGAGGDYLTVREYTLAGAATGGNSFQQLSEITGSVDAAWNVTEMAQGAFMEPNTYGGMLLRAPGASDGYVVVSVRPNIHQLGGINSMSTNLATSRVAGFPHVQGGHTYWIANHSGTLRLYRSGAPTLASEGDGAGFAILLSSQTLSPYTFLPTETWLGHTDMFALLGDGSNRRLLKMPLNGDSPTISGAVSALAAAGVTSATGGGGPLGSGSLRTLTGGTLDSGNDFPVMYPTDGTDSAPTTVWPNAAPFLRTLTASVRRVHGCFVDGVPHIVATEVTISSGTVTGGRIFAAPLDARSADDVLFDIALPLGNAGGFFGTVNLYPFAATLVIRPA